MANKNSPPDPLRAEIDRLRQILWEIARMTGFEGPEKAPAVGDMEVDIPEVAMDSVKQHLADYLTYTGPQGRDVNPEAGPDDRCSCGQTITWLHGTWIHLYNDRLSRRSHTASPATGYYDPESIVPIPAQPETVEPPDVLRVLGEPLEQVRVTAGNIQYRPVAWPSVPETVSAAARLIRDSELRHAFEIEPDTINDEEGPF